MDVVRRIYTILATINKHKINEIGKTNIQGSHPFSEIIFQDFKDFSRTFLI